MESFIPSTDVDPERTIQAATTGPAKGPQPASSTPAITFTPSLTRSCSYLEFTNFIPQVIEFSPSGLFTFGLEDFYLFYHG